MSAPLRSVQELYDDTAARWVRDRPASLSDFTARIPLLAWSEPEGLAVLDAGCGEGYFARALMRAGAASVDGIDISPGMIARAVDRERTEPLGIRYHVGSATDLSAFTGAGFDLCVAVFLFNYLDKADTTAAMRGIAAALKPGGRFLFAVPHPSFPFLRDNTPPFYFDRRGGGYFSCRDRWLDGQIWRRDGVPLDVRMCHKTLEDYFEALAAAGFQQMPKVREFRITPELLAEDSAEGNAPFFSLLDDVPLHLAMEIAR